MTARWAHGVTGRGSAAVAPLAVAVSRTRARVVEIEGPNVNKAASPKPSIPTAREGLLERHILRHVARVLRRCCSLAMLPGAHRPRKQICHEMLTAVPPHDETDTRLNLAGQGACVGPGAPSANVPGTHACHMRRLLCGGEPASLTHGHARWQFSSSALLPASNSVPCGRQLDVSTRLPRA